MSNKSKSLSKDEVRAHLKSQWKTEGNCGSNSWVVAEEEYCLPGLHEAKNYPVSLVCCEECGAMMFFSSEIIRRTL